MAVRAHPAPVAQTWTVAGFTGVPAPPAPLTWGQRALWTAMHRRGPEQATINLRRIIAAPRRGADPAAAVRAVGALLSRHSSLRTRLQVVDGHPCQVAAAAGELPVLLVDAPPADGGTDGMGTAEAVADRLSATPFDHEREWPQRVALVLVDGLVRQVVCVFSHTTVDFRAVEMVLRDLRLLLLRGTVTAPAGAQSVDIAHLEQGADRLRSQRAVAYWVRNFGRLPPQTLPRLAPPAVPRFRRTVLVSEAADTAVRLIVRRCRVTSPTVLLTAVAAVLSAWSGTEICGIHSMAGNRALPGYDTAIAKLNQIALIMIDLTGRPSFEELLARAWQAALEGYRHSHYDPDELRREFAAAGYPYEAGINPHCYINDIRLSTDADLTGRATGEEQLRHTMTRSSFAPPEGREQFTWRLRVEILDAPRGVAIALTGDTACLPPHTAERFLHDIERLLVEAAFRDLSWPWLPHPPTLECGNP